MNTIETILLTPGGREESETHSFEDFFELLTDCLESREAVERALAQGVFPVNEIEYRFRPSTDFARFAEPRLAGLPGPEPARPFAPGGCVAVTFPFRISALESLEELRPSQGLSFHRQDLTQASRGARGAGRGLLERTLWETLLAFPAGGGARYAGFHLGARMDRYRVPLAAPAINALLVEITKSAYRPAREMLDYLSYHRPAEIELLYSCERARDL